MLQPLSFFRQDDDIGGIKRRATAFFSPPSSTPAAHIAMDDNPQTDWYLVRTKIGKERWVRDQLANAVPEVFLPMLKAKAPRWGRMVTSIAPLFPCYVFARFDLQRQYFDVKYMPGVIAIFS